MGLCVPIESVSVHYITPPVGEIGIAETKANANDDNAEGETDIQGTGQGVDVAICLEKMR